MKPLAMQLIHWFSSPACAKTDEAAAVVDAIFASLDRAHNEAPQRDFAAQALREFLQWSLRQDVQGRSGGERITSVLERLCQLTHHPSSDKRLGAAVAFNAVYECREFREKEELLNAFTFLLLDGFVHSMALAEREKDGQGEEDRRGRRSFLVVL